MVSTCNEKPTNQLPFLLARQAAVRSCLQAPIPSVGRQKSSLSASAAPITRTVPPLHHKTPTTTQMPRACFTQHQHYLRCRTAVPTQNSTAARAKQSQDYTRYPVHQRAVLIAHTMYPLHPHQWSQPLGSDNHCVPIARNSRVLVDVSYSCMQSYRILEKG